MTGPVDQLQTYRYRHTVTDSSGVAANAGTVTVTVTLPDGTTATPTVTNSSTGVYDIAYTTTQFGLHNLKGSATGGVLGTEVDVWEDAFTVEEPKRQIIGIDEASNHLRAVGLITSTADREQLRWLCLVASSAVEADLGRVVARRTVVETYDGGKPSVQLRSTPLISITSVVEAGTTLAVGTYTADTAAGILRKGASTSIQNFSYGSQNIVVTYVAGYVNPPREIRKAALNLVQAMWQTSQQASHPFINEDFAGTLVSGALEGLTPIEQRAYLKRKNLAGFA